jgi:endonuclease/exonuclease/phosphatase family metal-dependent hydrolase
MTLNIWNYNPLWEERRRLIADLIMAQAPDVVAMQETRHDRRFEGGKGQGEQVAGLTDYHATEAVAQVYLPVLRVDEGLTILTRKSPLDHAVRRLTLHPHDRHDENHRICLGVTVEQDGRTVHVVDTHFSLSREARRTNAAEALEFIERWPETEPAVLMGDLNAEPDESSVQYLLSQGKWADRSGALIDCWTAANAGDPGYTYSSAHPVRRIDYILARNFEPGGIRAWLVGDEARDGIYPSDHLGIVADLPLC